LIMDYALEIPDYNIQPHIDIENQLLYKRNGLLTFTVRISGGRIVDLCLIEYVEPIRNIKRVIVKEFTITRTIGIGNPEDAIRRNDG